MVGARSSPRVTSDLGPGRGVGVRLRTTWGMWVRASCRRQCVLAGAQTAATAATATTPNGGRPGADGAYAAGCGTGVSTCAEGPTSAAGAVAAAVLLSLET